MTDKMEEQAFKIKVLNTLKATKFQDSLRSMMRLKMIEKLKGQSITKSSAPKKPSKFSEKLTYSLLYNFLSANNMNMTISILTPELGEDYALLPDHEIAEILSQSRPGVSEVLTKMASKGISSLLEGLIFNLLDYTYEKYDSSTQTMDSPGDLDLETKLLRIEEIHSKKTQEDTGSRAYEKMALEMEQRYKKNLESELNRILDTEVNYVKVNTETRFNERLQEVKDELESMYNTRLQKLQDKEEKLMEIYEQKARDLHSKITTAEDDLKRKMTEAERELQFSKKSISYDKSVLESQQDDLDKKLADIQRRESEVKAKEESYSNRLQLELEAYKNSTLSEISQKKSLIDTKLRQLETELEKLPNLERNLTAQKQLNLELQNKLAEIRGEFDVLHEKERNSRKEYENIRDVVDVEKRLRESIERDAERLRERLNSYINEIDHQKLLNSQLKDVIGMTKREKDRIESDWVDQERRLRDIICKLQEQATIDKQRHVDKVIGKITGTQIAGATEVGRGIADIMKEIEDATRKNKENNRKLMMEIDNYEIDNGSSNFLASLGVPVRPTPAIPSSPAVPPRDVPSPTKDTGLVDMQAKPKPSNPMIEVKQPDSSTKPIKRDPPTIKQTEKKEHPILGGLPSLGITAPRRSSPKESIPSISPQQQSSIATPKKPEKSLDFEWGGDEEVDELEQPIDGIK